jgi:hypothetical protein
MGRTYATKRRTLLKIGSKHILTVRERCGFEPGTCKSTRRGAEFYSRYLEKQAHVRNDVKQSVGLVDISDCAEKVDFGSIRLSVQRWIKLGCYIRTFGESERRFFFTFFNACILLVEKAVTRTSKALIA